MGNTPYRYLIEYRLQKAMGLLTGSALSVGEIAQAVGFHSQSHFGRLFKTRTGYAPKDYRKSNEQKGHSTGACAMAFFFGVGGRCFALPVRT